MKKKVFMVGIVFWVCATISANAADKFSGEASANISSFMSRWNHGSFVYIE